MTKADPSKWDQCLCGKRKRIVKDRCYRCAAKAYEKARWQRSKAAKGEPGPCTQDAEELALCEAKRAIERGHVIIMTPDEVEEEGTAFIGTCVRCDRYLCVDVTETESPRYRAKPHRVYGKVHDDKGECPGEPDHLPAAIRRSLYELDYATGGAGNERKEGTVIDYANIAASRAIGGVL